MIVDLGWVDFDLCVSPSCPVAQLLLPNSHQPTQSWAHSGTLKIQVNLTHSTFRWDALYLNALTLRKGCARRSVAVALCLGSCSRHISKNSAPSFERDSGVGGESPIPTLNIICGFESADFRGLYILYQNLSSEGGARPTTRLGHIVGHPVSRDIL